MASPNVSGRRQIPLAFRSAAPRGGRHRIDIGIEKITQKDDGNHRQDQLPGPQFSLVEVEHRSQARQQVRQHFAEGKRYIEEISLLEMALPLIVIDCSEDANNNPDFVLTIDGIIEWEKKYGQIPAGSFVAMRTDWSKRWPDQDKMLNREAEG
jgi:hypothetical protein